LMTSHQFLNFILPTVNIFIKIRKCYKAILLAAVRTIYRVEQRSFNLFLSCLLSVHVLHLQSNAVWGFRAAAANANEEMNQS
jgi:hypothetical protein